MNSSKFIRKTNTKSSKFNLKMQTNQNVIHEIGILSEYTSEILRVHVLTYKWNTCKVNPET